MKRKKSGSEKAIYQPTPSEQLAISKQIARRNAKRTAPHLKVLRDGNGTNISPNHPNLAVASTLLMEVLGTDDPSFAQGLIRQLADAGKRVDEEKLNFLLGIIKGVEPNDQVEAMLAARRPRNIYVVRAGFPPHRGITATGKRRARAQQAGADVHKSNGGAQALPDRGRTEGHRAVRLGERGCPSDCRQCDSARAQSPTGEVCEIDSRAD
jgi:hypothetical protein